MLKLTTRQRYATRIMAFLASEQRNGSGLDRPCRKKEIAGAEGIPADYVEQICVKLKTGGLIRSHRGTHGGFSLTRAPALITVADVLEAVEGPMLLAPCIAEDCRRSSVCATRAVWEEANDALKKVFSSVTVAELAEQGRKMESTKTISFEI